jgi:hypothetical protein
MTLKLIYEPPLITSPRVTEATLTGSKGGNETREESAVMLALYKQGIL